MVLRSCFRTPKYIFMDDDVLDMFEFGDQDRSEFEDWLRIDQAAIGYVLESRSFHRKKISRSTWMQTLTRIIERRSGHCCLTMIP